MWYRLVGIVFKKFSIAIGFLLLHFKHNKGPMDQNNVLLLLDAPFLYYSGGWQASKLHKSKQKVTSFEVTRVKTIFEMFTKWQGLKWLGSKWFSNFLPSWQGSKWQGLNWFSYFFRRSQGSKCLWYFY